MLLKVKLKQKLTITINLSQKEHGAIYFIKLSFFPHIRKEKKIIENEINIKTNTENDFKDNNNISTYFFFILTS